MSALLDTPRERLAPSYLADGFTLRSWLLTTDHKRVAILYLLSITFFFFLGGLAALLMRLELLTPAPDLVKEDVYDRLFTTHGVLMVWFFLIPSIPTVLGNFLLPMMLGARDLAFPRLNLASWYVFMAGAVLTLVAVVAGGVDTGWTFYSPYSTTYTNPGVFWMVLGIFVTGFSSIMTGLNFIVTTHTLRAPGLRWTRLPIFVWSTYATSLILVLATPVLAVTLLAVGVEKLWGVGIFDPSLGGDPLLFQHLFWFYSHPAVYIMVLPAMGVVSEIVPCLARRPLFGYRFVAMSSMAIAVLGFLVWGHHMFVSGQSVYAGVVFSLLSFAVAIPSAVKVFNWVATLRGGRIHLDTPMLYAYGFVGLFVVGGLTGLFLATLSIDVQVHDTYFVVAHFHYIMVGGSVMAYLGGLHFWWPKLSGRTYPERLARPSAVLVFLGFNLTFLPQFVLGWAGMPRRYASYADHFQLLNVLSTAGATILGVGYLLPFTYLVASFRRRPDAPANPWGATGLEWTTASPPPSLNFARAPVVHHGPYRYDPRDPAEGFTAQDAPEDAASGGLAEHGDRPPQEGRDG